MKNMIKIQRPHIKKSISQSNLQQDTTPPQVKATTEVSPLAEKLIQLGMGKKQISFCLQHEDTAKDILKYLDEMPAKERRKYK